MSSVIEVGGDEALRTNADLLFKLILGDDRLRALFEGEDQAALRDKQATYLAAFLSEEDDVDTVGPLKQVYAHLEGKGLTDEQFDAIYDHLHDAMAHLGITGGMVHFMLEAFEDLREDLVKP